jgi:NadR type nicotinamide-nucleotide adenylyltransferase
MPLEHWEFIPRVVRPYFARRVAILGPESTGKTTLAAALADEFQTTWVPEFGREYCETRNALTLTLDDFEAIGLGQLALEEQHAREANRLLLCDTDLITTCTWSDLVVGRRPEWLHRAAAAQRYALTLVMSDRDVPWINDGTRVLESRRAEHMELLLAELSRHGREFHILEGSWTERHERARALVQGLVDSPTTSASIQFQITRRTSSRDGRPGTRT